MKHRQSRGVSSLEFAFGMLVLVPLFLGTGAIGINMIKSLQTIQLARDAGHMYARGIDFSTSANQVILANLGSGLGLSSTSGQGTAVVILSSILYIDKNQCANVNGGVDANGNPVTSVCTNYSYWVFTQRLSIGNSSVRNSNYGSPVTSGLNGVTVNSTTGKISQNDYITKSGARATFNGVNPYSVVNGVAQGLPSGQVLYLSEVGATGFNMSPFVSNAVSYSWGFF